jgi:hypothetical protein
MVIMGCYAESRWAKFYYFVIRNDGGYAIGKYKNAGFQSFFGGWRQSDAIK